MSFRVDLWNGLSIIKTQFNSMLNKMTNLSEILLSYANYEKTFSKNLESLYKLNKDSIKVNYLLDNSFLDIINNFKFESEYHQEHYKFIKNNIIVSIKEITENLKSSFNDIYNEGNQIQENYVKIKNNLIIKQKNYNNSLKEFNNFISNLDENEIKIIIDNEETDFNRVNNLKVLKKMQTICIPEKSANTFILDDNKNYKQLISKKEKLIDKINENKNEYISTLNEANIFLKDFNIKNENVLQSLEDKYKIILESYRSTFMTTMENSFQLLNKLNLLYTDFFENNLNKINIKNEIFEFIARNATKEFPLRKFEFISNKFDKNKNSYLDVNKYIKDNFGNEKNLNPGRKRGNSAKKMDAQKFRRKSIKKLTRGINENETLYLDSNEEIINYKIKSNIFLIEDFISELITNNGEEEKNILADEINNESQNNIIDINKIKSLIDKENKDNLIYLENLINFLNNERGKGNFLINKKSYNILIDIFKFILDKYSSYDFILKNIIILSQTFYTFEIDKNQLNFSSDKKKIFIQNGLKNNPIFNNEETWHRVINYTLSINAFNKDISQPIDKNEINNKLKILSHNTLISYLCDLQYFTDDKTIFNKIKSFYVKAYQLDEEEINKDLKNIINYDTKRKKGVSFSN